MVATILDLIRPEEREAMRQQALMNPGPYGVNALTQEPYNRPAAPMGWADFLQSPLKEGTPLGNIWSQVPDIGGRAPLSEGLFPWMTGYGAEDIPGLLPAGRAAKSLLTGDFQRPEQGWIGGPASGIRRGAEWLGEQAGNAWDAVNRRAWGEPPPEVVGLSEEAKKRQAYYQAGGAPGTYGQEQPKAGEGAGGKFMDLGAFPNLPPMPGYEGSQPPDFSQAIASLGAAPERPEQRPLSERLGRVLGRGAAQGAQAMRGTTGGHSIAAALAGAAGGSGEALGRISREEQARTERWRVMNQRHKESLASLQAQATSATSAHAQREAMAKLQAEQVKIQAERQEEMMKAPQIHRLGNGIVGVQRYNSETGRAEMETVDFLETWRNMEWMAKMAAAQKQGKTWFGGDLVLEGVPPHLARGAELAMTRLYTDREFADRVLQFMTENLDVDIEKLVGQILTPGGLDWKTVDPMITFSAMRLLGYETSELMKAYEQQQGKQ